MARHEPPQVLPGKQRLAVSLLLLLGVCLLLAGCGGYAAQADKYLTQARSEVLGSAYTLERLERRLNLRTWRTEDHIIGWNQIDSIEERRILLKVPQEAIEEFRLEDRSGSGS